MEKCACVIAVFMLSVLTGCAEILPTTPDIQRDATIGVAPKNGPGSIHVNTVVQPDRFSKSAYRLIGTIAGSVGVS